MRDETGALSLPGIARTLRIQPVTNDRSYMNDHNRDR